MTIEDTVNITLRETDNVAFFDDSSSYKSYTTETTEILIEENSQCVDLNNLFNDCLTVDKIIERLKNLLKEFEEIKQDNYELSQPVNNGYAFLGPSYSSNL